MNVVLWYNEEVKVTYQKNTMTHRFTDLFPQFSERRLVFQQPETVPEAAPDPVESIRLQLDGLTSGAEANAREQVLREVSVKLDEIKTTLTPEQRTRIQEILRKEKDEHVEEVDEKLEALAAGLEPPAEAALAPSPFSAEVSDIAPPKPESQKGFKDRVVDMLKGGGMAAIAPLIKGFIALKRALLEWFPPKDANGVVNTQEAERQLAGIERLYGQFFGALELQETFNKYCKEHQVTLTAVEGSGDGVAYADLKVRYQDELTARFAGKNEEQKAAILSAYTFEEFMREQMQKYVDTHKENFASGTEYETTLKGIVDGAMPRKRVVVQTTPPL